MSNCEVCGAAIMWAQSKTTGRTMPLDAQASAEATVLGRGPALEEARAQGRTLYKSHFATCPKAGEFRRKKR